MDPDEKKALHTFVVGLIDLEERGLLTDAQRKESLEFVNRVLYKITKPLPIEGVQLNDPEGAELLWALAGKDPETFASYVESVPDEGLRDLKDNPQKLEATIRLLSEVAPATIHAKQASFTPPIQSSNIYGFQYNPRNHKLAVKFQGNKGYGQGPTYEYSGVPRSIAEAFQEGAISAKTDGQNKWGRWWKHKNPSLGASHYALIRDLFPYKKVA